MAILSLVLRVRLRRRSASILGHIAKRQIAQTGEEGDGLATAGLVIGYIVTGLTVLACCGVLVA